MLVADDHRMARAGLCMLLRLEPDLEILGPLGAYLTERLGTAKAATLLGGAVAAAAQPALSPVDARERVKSQVVIAATAGGLTVALTIMLRMMLLRSPDNIVTLPRFFLHLGLGLVVGAIAYVVVYFRKP